MQLNNRIARNSLALSILSLFILVGSIFFSSVSNAKELKVLVVRLSGSVLIESSTSGNWAPVHKWMTIPLGAKIKTLPGSFLDLLINKAAIVRVKGESEFMVAQMVKGLEKVLSKAKPGSCDRDQCKAPTVIKLFKGKAFLYVSPSFSRLPFIVETPIGIAGVTGTRFAVDLTERESFIVAVYQGSVVVWNKLKPQKFVEVEPGFIVKLAVERLPETPKIMTDEERKRYEECLKLHFGLENNQAFLEIGSRYQGIFSRGYSPDVLSEFGPNRTGQYQYQGKTEQRSVVQERKEGNGSQVRKGSVESHSSTLENHSSKMDHHPSKDHHDMTDRHSRKDHGKMDRGSKDIKGMHHDPSSGVHSTPARSGGHHPSAVHDTHSSHFSSGASSTRGSSKAHTSKGGKKR